MTDNAMERHGHSQPCYYCQEPCDGFAGNPTLWPIGLCHADDPGVVKWHHTGCISRRLRALDVVVERGWGVVQFSDGRWSIICKGESAREKLAMRASLSNDPTASVIKANEWWAGQVRALGGET